jgi:hypothetical protein
MTCGHNKSFKERCIECELVLVREGLAWSERKASEYRDAVVRLEAELAPTKPQPNFAKSSLASGALTEPQEALRYAATKAVEAYRRAQSEGEVVIAMENLERALSPDEPRRSVTRPHHQGGEG